MKLGDLRRVVRIELHEAGGAARLGKPDIRNAMAPTTADREAIGSLGDRQKVGDDDDMDLPPHLREPELTPEECFGPVPPTGNDPYAIQDPYVRGASPLPTPQR